MHHIKEKKLTKYVMFVSRESQAYRQVFYPASGFYLHPCPQFGMKISGKKSAFMLFWLLVKIDGRLKRQSMLNNIYLPDDLS